MLETKQKRTQYSPTQLNLIGQTRTEYKKKKNSIEQNRAENNRIK